MTAVNDPVQRFVSRRFVSILAAMVLGHLPAQALAAEPLLPLGPAPVSVPHFPDRMHALVWRNWQAVEPGRLAQVLGTSVENVTAVARSMGLPPATAIPPEHKARAYITLVRRNWHLLPYDPLLVLLDMTRDQLGYALREDDMLSYKLALMKPDCPPLGYQPPDAQAQRRAAEIKAVVEQYFGDELGRPAEPRFAFVQQLSEPQGPAVKLKSEEKRLVALRCIHSCIALFGDPLLRSDIDPYPDGLLERLAEVGVNGVWLHVVLRSLAPGGEAFPEFGANHATRLDNLRKLVERAKRYGIGVYLYLNEPRAMPEAFFRSRPELGGVRERDHRALCTSQPVVRAWMADALEHVFKTVPELGGVFAITASENLTNCASHHAWQQCPRCGNRSDTEIIAEVIATIEAGVHRGNPSAKVIAWDWGWRRHGDAAEIIAALPKSVWLMSVSEWALPLERGGVKTVVGEYAMSAVGPGPRASRHWALAKQRGLKTVAKVQLNNTWELSAVPYLPVMDLVAQHCHNLASAGVDGIMLSWSLGGYPSPNLQIADHFSRRPTPGIDQVLDHLARQRFGSAGAPYARKAWTAMSCAFTAYPYGGGLYKCPVQWGPANLLYASKTGYGAAMVAFPYDDLNGWRGPYPPEVFAAQFEKVAAGWRQGLVDLRAAVEQSPAAERADAEAELRFSRAAWLHFQSVANQTRFVMARDALADTTHPLSPHDRRRQAEELRRIVRDEIALARELFTLTRLDSRIGFDPSNQYYYLPLDLVEKVINCRYVLDQFPAPR